MLSARMVAVALVAMLAAGCTGGGADGRGWEAQSAVLEGQESDCASAPVIESVMIDGDHALLLIRFPNGSTDTRAAAWVRDDDRVHVGSTMTWSEWTLRGAELADAEDGTMQGIVTWDGWYTCAQSVEMVPRE